MRLSQNTYILRALDNINQIIMIHEWDNMCNTPLKIMSLYPTLEILQQL